MPLSCVTKLGKTAVLPAFCALSKGIFAINRIMFEMRTRPRKIMNIFLLQKTVKNIDTAEAVIGDFFYYEKNMILPSMHANVMSDTSFTLSVQAGKYINFCYLVFEGVETLTFDYEVSRFLQSENRECYGGEHYHTQKHIEFWIVYESSKLYGTANTQFLDSISSSESYDPKAFFSTKPNI